MKHASDTAMTSKAGNVTGLVVGLLVLGAGVKAFVTEDSGLPWYPHAVAGMQARVLGVCAMAYGTYIFFVSLRRLRGNR